MRKRLVAALAGVAVAAFAMMAKAAEVSTTTSAPPQGELSRSD